MFVRDDVTSISHVIIMLYIDAEERLVFFYFRVPIPVRGVPYATDPLGPAPAANTPSSGAYYDMTLVLYNTISSCTYVQ